MNSHRYTKRGNCAGIVLAALWLAAPAAAQTVANGSFEDPVVFRFVSFSGGGLTGWTVGPGAPPYPQGPYPQLVHDEFGIADTPYGDQVALLGDYFGNGFSYVEQAISGFVVGRSYQLSFAVATHDSGCGGGCGQAAVTVSFPAGSSTTPATFIAPVSGSVYGLRIWADYTYPFIASDTTVTIRFTQAPGVDPGLRGGVGLDTVAVTPLAPPNEAPTANAGSNQTVRPGATVQLDGSGSFDDNTPTGALLYAWSFDSRPSQSEATLLNDTSVAPTFVPDQSGTYIVRLVVTDQDGLSSNPSFVTIGENPPPAADAGADQLVIVGSVVTLNGSGTDPDNDTLTYAWELIRPAGSVAQVANPGAAVTTIAPDQPGTYFAQLTVSDFLGAGDPDVVQITAMTLSGYIDNLIEESSQIILGLSAGSVTNRGNQNALTQFLSNAVVAMQAGDLADAYHQIEQAISRTDGCVLRGRADGNGAGRDWVNSCAAQAQIYPLLTEILVAIEP